MFATIHAGICGLNIHKIDTYYPFRNEVANKRIENPAKYIPSKSFLHQNFCL